MTEEFPSFNKATREELSEKTKLSSSLLIGVGVLVVALSIFFSFRFLVGAKTPRAEILAQALSSSQSGQSSLLLEWMQNIEQDSQGSWNPTATEQVSLLNFAASKISELKQEVRSPALYALHVAGWGPGVSDRSEILELMNANLVEEARLAVALYLVRQKDFAPEAITYLRAFLNAPNETQRKVAALYFAQCVESALGTQIECQRDLLGLLSDAAEEVRWNAVLGVLRVQRSNAQTFSEAELTLAGKEFAQLYQKLKVGDPTLLSRFQGAALLSLATEVFKAKLLLSPEDGKKDLQEIVNSHPDLRIRNAARSLQKL